MNGTRLLRTLELQGKGKRPMAQSKTRWFSQVLEGFKRTGTELAKKVI
jgi:hypothetical protein